MQFATTWMELEDLMLSKVSQERYKIISHMSDIKKHRNGVMIKGNRA